MKALARLVGPVPGHDHPIELQILFLDTEQLSTERSKACTSNLRHSLVVRVGNNLQQFRDPRSTHPFERAPLTTGLPRLDGVIGRPSLWIGSYASG